METRLCKRCQQILLLTDFPLYRGKRVKNARRLICRNCRNTQTREWYADKQAGIHRPRYVRITEKVCNSCVESKPVEQFYKNSKSKGGGYRQPCKVCTQVTTPLRRKEQIAVNPLFLERERAYCATYRKKHPETRKETVLNYSRTHPEKRHQSKQRRRAREANAPFIETVSLDVLYKRDKGICQLCHTKCRRIDASHDHVIPLSLGGETSYRNAVLTHITCNVAKNNRSVTQQMRLFG